MPGNDARSSRRHAPVATPGCARISLAKLPELVWSLSPTALPGIRGVPLPRARPTCDRPCLVTTRARARAMTLGGPGVSSLSPSRKSESRGVPTRGAANEPDSAASYYARAGEGGWGFVAFSMDSRARVRVL
jgi:hypothetical protein